METGIELIARAQAEQLEKGWSLEHDKQHIMGELRQAAVCFLETADFEDVFDAKECIEHRKMWPFDTEFNPSSDRIENLAKAGALIAAEIDRLIMKEK